MSKKIIELDSKSSLNKNDVFLVSANDGTMSKISTLQLKNAIGANCIEVKDNTASISHSGASFVVGGSNETDATTVISSYGSAMFDKQKKGQVFSVSDTLVIKDSNTILMGEKLIIEQSDSCLVSLKGSAFFQVGTFKVNTDGVACARLNAKKIKTTELAINSIDIKSDNGKFEIISNGKNSKKEIVPFASLSGTDKSFDISLSGKTELSIKKDAIGVSGSLTAKTVSAEILTTKISGKSVSIYSEKTQAIGINEQGMKLIDLKIDTVFSGTTTLQNFTNNQIDQLKPSAGTIIFNKTAKAFQGYNGTSWVTFK